MSNTTQFAEELKELSDRVRSAQTHNDIADIGIRLAELRSWWERANASPVTAPLVCSLDADVFRPLAA